jgi:hypothetical protein
LPGNPGRPQQSRILGENPALQLTQLFTRLDPQLVDEQRARFRVNRQRLALPPGPVERQHQLSTEPLAERIRIHQRLQLAHHRGLASEREVSVDPRLQRRQAALPHPAGLRTRERFVRNLG